ncbi:LysR substrate-binding domain-containing protein [Achromobacter veterisilvae]|uniref:LysR substrate-binding domain-containing protein n=1 Tax=Achromobacter veterisilvae TaxID=2069367 RepID=UPI00100FC0C7
MACVRGAQRTTCCALVRSGLGVSALPRMGLGLTDMEGLVCIPLVAPSVFRSVGLVTRIGRSLSPASLAFLGMLGG